MSVRTEEDGVRYNVLLVCIEDMLSNLFIALGCERGPSRESCRTLLIGYMRDLIAMEGDFWSSIICEGGGVLDVAEDGGS